jgi:DHA2 family multidrug resistance protein
MINTAATARLAVHTLHLDEQVTWSRPGAMNFINGLTQAMTPGKGTEASLAALKQVALMVRQQALTLTYNDVLMMMAVAFFVALPLTLFLAKPAMGGAVEAH